MTLATTETATGRNTAPAAGGPVLRVEDLVVTAPGGTPARSQASARRKRLRGESSGDFSTTVLPVTSAQAMDRAPTGSGPFHGTIWAETPKGSCTV